MKKAESSQTGSTCYSTEIDKLFFQTVPQASTSVCGKPVRFAEPYRRRYDVPSTGIVYAQQFACSSTVPRVTVHLSQVGSNKQSYLWQLE